MAQKLKIWGPKKRKELEKYFKTMLNIETENSHPPEKKEVISQENYSPFSSSNIEEELKGNSKNIGKEKPTSLDLQKDRSLDSMELEENVGIITRFLYSQETLKQME